MERPQREETANAITHGLATVLAVVGAVWLMVSVSGSGNPALIVACLVYAISMVGVFFCSTMSHLMKTSGSRRLFRKLDQAFIYLFIVATYTPFSVAFLDATLWWILLGAMWLVAITGFVSKIFRSHRIDTVSIWGYVALGWMPALGGLPLSRLAPAGASWGIVAGGVLYTIGTIFLFNDGKVWYFHAIWHLMVVAGAAVHWWVTMTYVV